MYNYNIQGIFSVVFIVNSCSYDQDRSYITIPLMLMLFFLVATVLSLIVAATATGF